MPRHQAMIVTCMDGRIDPAHLLQLDLGDALVMRNGGGRVSDDVVHEVAFIDAVTDMMLGDDAPPFEVAIVHHTGCGTGLLADPAFRATLTGVTGVTDHELNSVPRFAVYATHSGAMIRWSQHPWRRCSRWR